MEIEIIGMIVIFTVVIIVGIAIVTSFLPFKNLVPTQLKNVYTKVVTSIGFKSPFNICESFSGQKISLQDFQILLQAVNNGQCGTSHANVSLSFSLTKSDLERIATLDGIALNGKLIFYNTTSSLGIGAILVQGDPGQYPLKFEDFVDISSSGSPIPDVLIGVTLKGCDPYDNVCDSTCAFKGICDPVCDDGSKHNIPCNLACIDTNGNGIIDEQDAQQRIQNGKCNPDCYGNFTNPFGAYDPGCVWKYKSQNDDICDPNSNGVKDGACDPDCLKTKNICDPDCNGVVSEGNPYGLNDTKCFICDGTCNGWCSPSCNKNALPGDSGFDPDCYKQINSSYFCSGDGVCDTSKGENCANSADCPGGGLTCGDYHAACCPIANNADISGCSSTINVSRGGSCSCGTQCASGLLCDDTNHCCPQNMKWNGTQCESVCIAGPYDRFICNFYPVTYNHGLDVCKPVVQNAVQRWIYSNPTLTAELRSGKYDDVVRALFKQSFSLYGNGARYDPAVQACTGSSTTVSGLISGTNYYGVCNHWAAVGTSLLRTAGVPPDRVYSLGMEVSGGGHAVTLYKSDNGELWILDYTCCMRLFKASDWSSCGPCACASTIPPFCNMDNDFYSGACTSLINGIC